jgi:hypothetical protein
MDGAADLTLSRRQCGRTRRRRPSAHIFFAFMVVIFMALPMCIEQPAMSFCDMEDFADVISCIAIVLFSPSGIFMTAASVLAMPASVQPAIFGLAAEAGTAVIAMATATAQAVLIIMLVPQNRSRLIAGHEKRLLPIRVP